MTLNKFTLFATVAKHRSMRKASEELRVSQPSVSQQLKQLEGRYGVKLYRRVSKGVEITKEGQLFLHSITPILEQVAKLESGFKPCSLKAAPEVLSIGGTFSASAVLLPKLLARLRDRHPHTDFEFQTGTSEHLERMVARSTMQIAVTDRQPSWMGLAWERLRREKVVAFVRADHPLARQQTVKLSQLLAEPLILRGGKGISGTTEKALKKLRDEGWVVRVSMRCDGPAAIKAAVRQNMGVGMAFEDSVRMEIDSGEFKALAVDGLALEGESFMIYAEHRPISPLAQEFLDLLRKSKVAEPSDKRAKRSNGSIVALRSSSGSVRSKRSSRSTATLRSNGSEPIRVSTSPETSGLMENPVTPVALGRTPRVP